MNTTVEILKAEVKRLRSLADRMEAFILELDGKPQPVVGIRTPHTFYGGPEKEREFDGLTQHAAILQALETYGPQTTKELFDRLNAGGMAFKKRVYITAILGRLKHLVERTDDNKIKLKPGVTAANQ